MLAAILAITIGFLAWSTPAGSMIVRFLPPVGVGLLAVLCFREWFRQDRVAFFSVIGPAFVVALASTLAPPPWLSLTGAIPPLFLALFIFDVPGFRLWWWQHVLRRPAPTSAQTASYRLHVALKDWSDSLRSADGPIERQLEAAEHSIQKLREIDLPDPDWSALRDDLVDATEHWTALARTGGDAEEWRPVQETFATLHERLRELRERT